MVCFDTFHIEEYGYFRRNVWLRLSEGSILKFFGFKKWVQEKPPMRCNVLRWVFSCHISIIHHSIHRYEDGEKVGDHQPGVVTTERLEGFKSGSRALSTRRGIKLFDLCSCYSNRSLEVDLRWVYECLNTARWQGNLDYGGLKTVLGSKKTSF